MKNQVVPEKTVLPIHFEDRSGSEFERLCFAYILRMREWKSIDWYGQLGSDSGRDIWAISVDDYRREESFCFQCANHKSLKFEKAKKDIDKIIKGPNKSPDHFILILGGKLSANMKDRIKRYAKSKKIKSTETWSGPEFEERLRKNTPSLVRRFCDGEEFPESYAELKLFVFEAAKASDHEILSLFAQCFDRPAFKTPFNSESSIPAFKKAIDDTIEVLNTGIHRLRDGTVIRKIPSRHDLQDKKCKEVLSAITDKLIHLRAKYDDLIKSRDIRPCGCNNPECSVFMLSSRASCAMDKLRVEILEIFRSIYPEFIVSLPWRR